MERMDLIATTTFGLEAVAKRELIALGYKDITLENGKVKFKGTPEDIVKANIWLRTAERVLIQVGEFKAITFDELFEKTKDLPGKIIYQKMLTLLLMGKVLTLNSFQSQIAKR